MRAARQQLGGTDGRRPQKRMRGRELRRQQAWEVNVVTIPLVEWDLENFENNQEK